MGSPLTTLLTGLLLLPSLLTGEEEVEVPRITIPAAWYHPAPDGQWHGSPPEFKREWGWTQFPKTSNFVLREGGEPGQKTEIRLYYTPKTLYIAAILHDAHIDKLVRGVSPLNFPKDAPLEWLADVFEVFIQPDLSSPIYYQLGVNPNGARFDQVKGKGAPVSVDGSGWDGRWRVGTKILKDRWQVEMAIELASLGLSGDLRGTPMRGSEMGITFCRSAGHWKELSSWGVAGTWHRTDKFGRIVFGPRLDRASWKNHPLDPDDVIVNDIDSGSPDLGKYELQATLANPGPKPMKLLVKLTVGDTRAWSLDPVKVIESAEEIELPPDSHRKIKMAYEVTEGRGRDKTLTFTVRRPEYQGPSYHAVCRFRIFPLKKKVAEMRGILERIQEECDKARDLPSAIQAKEHSRKILEGLEEISASKASPANAILKAKTAEKETAKLRLLFANRIRPRIYARAAGMKNPGFFVGTALATTKVFPDAPFEGQMGKPVRISLARNERRSSQCVILATSKDLKEVRFRVLTEKPGPVSFETFRVGTVSIDTSLPVRNGAWPDPLYPTDRTTAKFGVPQPVIVTAHAGPETPSGIYRSRLRFEAEGFDSVEIPFDIEVYDFALPQRMSLFNEIWWDSVRPGVYYNRITPELFEKFCRLASDYHAVPGIDFFTVQRNLKFVKKPGEPLGLDWTDVDPYLKIMRKYGRQRQNINFSHTWTHWPGFFAKSVYYFVPGRSQARHYRSPNPNADYERFLRSSYDHLRSLGWKADDLYYVGGDEPWSQKVRDEMRPGYEIAHKVIPELRRSSAAAHPGMKNIDDIIDIWCPQVREFDPAAYRKDSREVWMYTCGWKFPPYPCYSVHVPGMAARITGWVCRKFNVTGFLYWGSNVWEIGNDINLMRVKPPAEKRWITDGWRPALTTGDGILYYPTPEGPIASQRLLCIRDSTEDYEYLTILRRLAAEAKTAPERLVTEARELASVPDRIVKSTTEWTQNANELEAARIRAAELIVALSAHARKR